MNVHVTISADPKLLEKFDYWWKANDFKSRSDALAYLIRTVVPSAKEETPY
jgi:metal-responsive CopG/Arc/MetJ family transcriptional regulator